MTIKQNDPGAVFNTLLRQSIDRAMADVVASGRYILGEQVSEFESELAEWVNARHAIGVANGTDAITIALKAAGIGDGDIVFCPALTAWPTAAAILATGAECVAVDIDARHYTMNPEALALAIHRIRRMWPRPNRLAVVPVHLYGHPCDMTAIANVAGANGISIVEDCAQAHGAAWGNMRVGLHSHAAAFSFYPTKNMPAMGDAGAIVTNLPEVAETARRLREYGWDADRRAVLAGAQNSRLDELQAAILRAVMPAVHVMNDIRKMAADRYTKRMKNCQVTTPRVHPLASHVYHQYVIETDNRDALRKELFTRGIETGVHYAMPIHRQPVFEGQDITLGLGCPIADRAASRVLSLPMHPCITASEIDAVCEAIHDAQKNLRR
jgi:dTDP-4-amino-4,6-dideoxygalactose transaminase